MRGLSFNTIETVAPETLAIFATSRRLTDLPPVRDEPFPGPRIETGLRVGRGTVPTGGSTSAVDISGCESAMWVPTFAAPPASSRPGAAPRGARGDMR